MRSNLCGQKFVVGNRLVHEKVMNVTLVIKWIWEIPDGFGICAVKSSLRYMVVVDRVSGLVGLDGVVRVVLHDPIISDHLLHGLKVVVVPVRHDDCNARRLH